MLRGRFAQAMEFLFTLLIVIGIISLCQPWSHALFRRGFNVLLLGVAGLTLFSHRKPVTRD